MRPRTGAKGAVVVRIPPLLLQMVEARDLRQGDLLATPDGPVEVTIPPTDERARWHRYDAPMIGVGTEDEPTWVQLESPTDKVGVYR